MILICTCLLQCALVYVPLLVPSSRKKIKYLFIFARDFIYANSDSTPKNFYTCDQMAVNLFSKSVKIVLLVLFSLNLTTCLPLYNIFFNSASDSYNKIIVPIILPFIDFRTQQGFYINLANQIYICLIGAVAVPYIESMTCVMINNCSVSAAVIGNTLTEFGGSIKRMDRFSEREDQLSEYTQRFKNIIVQMRDFDRFFKILFS